MKRSMLLTGAAAVALATGVAAQTSEDYPSRTVRIIVTQAAGSGMDIQARIVAQKMSELWGQQWVVDNRPGANGIIGMDAVAKAKPDGYTLVYASASVLAMNPFIYKSLPYNTLRDFTPITQTGANPMGLVGLVQKQGAFWRVRPNHKVVVKGEWETSDQRLAAAERILSQLAKVALQAAA